VAARGVPAADGTGARAAADTVSTLSRRMPHEALRSRRWRKLGRAARPGRSGRACLRDRSWSRTGPTRRDPLSSASGEGTVLVFDVETSAAPRRSGMGSGEDMAWPAVVYDVGATRRRPTSRRTWSASFSIS